MQGINLVKIFFSKYLSFDFPDACHEVRTRGCLNLSTDITNKSSERNIYVNDITMKNYFVGCFCYKKAKNECDEKRDKQTTY